MVAILDFQSKQKIKLHHIMLYRRHLARAGFELITLEVIGTDCKGSCKSNDYTIIVFAYHLYITVIQIQFFWGYNSILQCHKPAHMSKHLLVVMYLTL
jgi:hypothetical protein